MKWPVMYCDFTPSTHFSQISNQRLTDWASHEPALTTAGRDSCPCSFLSLRKPARLEHY
jgi:hypothetical protein